MTELEKIEYTKKFIDKLANGINPIDGVQIPESDIMNNVRLVRCMFYVSDILRQVIDNGGIRAKSSYSGVRKTEFNLTPEQIANYNFSDVPIPISEIAKRLNDLSTADNMKKMTHNKITAWLIQSNILEEVELEKKKVKRPTEAGKNLGISTERREGMNGPYTVVVYNRAAQQFLIDNFDAILAYNSQLKQKTAS